MTRNKAIIGFMRVAQMSHEISEKGHPFCLGAQCAKWHSSQARALYRISIDRDRSEAEGDDWHSHSETQIAKVRRLERKIQKMLEEISLTTACVQKTAENKCGNTGGEYEGGNLDCNM